MELTELANNAFGFMDEKLTLEQIQTAIDGIVEKYRSEFYPFEVRESGGGLQFLTKKEYHKTVAQLNGEKFLKRLSTAALETLSIIAYKQPVTKGEIEAIRGVSSDYAIQRLLEKELVVITGRNEKMPGHPLVYATSKSFMDYFGINSADDLPKLKEIFDEAMVSPTIMDGGQGVNLTDDSDQESSGTNELLAVTQSGELTTARINKDADKRISDPTQDSGRNADNTGVDSGEEIDFDSDEESDVDLVEESGVESGDESGVESVGESSDEMRLDYEKLKNDESVEKNDEFEIEIGETEVSETKVAETEVTETEVAEVELSGIDLNEVNEDRAIGEEDDDLVDEIEVVEEGDDDLVEKVEVNDDTNDELEEEVQVDEGGDDDLAQGVEVDGELIDDLEEEVAVVISDDEELEEDVETDEDDEDSDNEIYAETTEEEDLNDEDDKGKNSEVGGVGPDDEDDEDKVDDDDDDDDDEDDEDDEDDDDDDEDDEQKKQPRTDH